MQAQPERRVRTRSERRSRPVLRAGFGIAAFAMVLAVSVAVVTAEDAPSPGGTTASEAEVEMLRKLLGLPPAAKPEPAKVEPAAPAPTPAVEVAPKPAPAPPKKVAPKPAPKPQPVKKVAPKPAPKPKPVVKPAPKPAVKPAPRPAPKPAVKPAPRPAPRPVPKAVPEPAPVETPALEAAKPALPPPPAPGSDQDVPAPGAVVTAENMERWSHLLGPSVQWSVARGATLDVIAPKEIPFEKARAEATQRYHDQVRLAPDKRSIQNFVAGIPFPFVTPDDPDVATKTMFNMENRVVVDDMDIRHFGCDTGSLDVANGFQVQRHYLNEHFRRLFYVGRLYHEPKPIWQTTEGVRYREMLYPLLEPFDLKGAGFSYIRYLDPNRQDDSWLYFPQIKRLRRLSTAQRSEGVFGQDIDLDSYGGFSGNPAWMTWTFLGKKTILASMHANKHHPPRFQKKPADFFPDGLWEPREVYVILGVSTLGGYNFGRRVVYVDVESMLVPYTELYDLKGQLWRALVHIWNVDHSPRPGATRAVYPDEMVYINALSLMDMQLEHSTMCRFPAEEMVEEDGWYYNFGEAEGVTEEVFSVSNFIETGR